MHDVGVAPNISRPGYGDSITAMSLLAGIMSALYIREKTGWPGIGDIALQYRRMGAGI